MFDMLRRGFGSHESNNLTSGNSPGRVDMRDRDPPNSGLGAHESREAGYVSELTRFMDQFLEEHPEITADQRRGFHIYWDRKVDFAEQEKAREDSVPVDSYYYFGNPWPHDEETQ